MRKIPMIFQLTFILFCVMAIPIAILNGYSSSQIFRNSEHAIGQSSVAGLNASRMLNENALRNLSQSTVRLASTSVFDSVRPLQSYAELNAGYEHISKARMVQRELMTLVQSIDGVYSAYFHLDHSDYVISTDKGMMSLDNYESTDWLAEALDARVGIHGVWYPRRLDAGVNVMSFVLPLNSLSTATRGTIVVNLEERQIEQYLQLNGEQHYVLMNEAGMVLSHQDKSLLLNDMSEEPFIQDILSQPYNEGYDFYESDGERLLYTWSRSHDFSWINVGIYSMDELLDRTHVLTKDLIMLTLIIILAGSIFTIFVARWVSQPVRNLARAMRTRIEVEGGKRNEMLFLEDAFKRMQEEEQELHKLLEEKERDSRSLAALNLLRGEVTPQAEEMFAAPYFHVVVVCVDGYRKYVARNNPEARRYHKYLFISQCNDWVLEDAGLRCIYHGDGQFVMIINHNQSHGESSDPFIESLCERMQSLAADTLENSVTIGISSQSESLDGVSDLFAEALETMKRRLVAGSGCILSWNEEKDVNKKYVYSVNSETRILNFLDQSDLKQIKAELATIRKEIRSSSFISYDNIMFIYHQLVGVTIKHLRENNINNARIFAKRGNMYAALAACDTIDEIEEYLISFYEEIIQFFDRDEKETSNYGEKIVNYLKEHYAEAIVFEDMAKEIGISYSYMRKIAYEMTGISLIDYLNKLRVEEAKTFLVETQWTIAQIASEVGYYNVRSLNHFFRKFEGMTPSSYRAEKSRQRSAPDN